MAADEVSSELPTVLEGQVSSRIAKRMRESSRIPKLGKITKGTSLPDLSRDRYSSPLPSSSISRLAVPCSLGPTRSFHPTTITMDTKKPQSFCFGPAALSPVINRRTSRTRTFTELNKQELLSPVLSKRDLANTVFSPVQTRKDFVSSTKSCPSSPRFLPTTSGREFTKSRPATPYILSSSPSPFAPGNSDKLPRIVQSHSPRLVRPLSPIRMPLDSMRGLFNISPVLRVRASDSESEESSGSCCDLQEKVSSFLNSMTLEEA